MRINWRIRFINPVFWVHVAAALFVPVSVHFGVNLEQITTGAALGGLMLEAVSNPSVVFAMGVSLWNLIVDPTTRGESDSVRALRYNRPG
jgi:phi LC3 family holin